MDIFEFEEEKDREKDKEKDKENEFSDEDEGKVEQDQYTITRGSMTYKLWAFFHFWCNTVYCITNPAIVAHIFQVMTEHNPGNRLKIVRDFFKDVDFSKNDISLVYGISGLCETAFYIDILIHMVL